MFKNLEKIRKDMEKDKRIEKLEEKKRFDCLCKRFAKYLTESKKQEIIKHYIQFEGRIRNCLFLDLTSEEYHLDAYEVIRSVNERLVGKGIRVALIEKYKNDTLLFTSVHRYMFEVSYIREEIEEIMNKNKVGFFKRIIKRIFK